MIQEDTYKTITDIAEGIYTEKRSKFIAIAIPVRTIEEIKQHLDTYQKKYYDARHVCYAYMLGHERKDFRANDNGEPSGTAGKPILGQINSNELTDILIIVVRYFGGIKLGTSGLIVAYKAAAAEAIAAADIVERTVDEEITVSFEYPFMNDIMRIVKEDEPAILEQSYDMDCLMRLRIRKSMMGKLRARLEKVETARIIEYLCRYVDIFGAIFTAFTADEKNTECGCKMSSPYQMKHICNMDEILQIYRTYIFAAVNKESHINKNEKYTCSVCFYNAEYCNCFRTADYS